jgi:membrane protein
VRNKGGAGALLGIGLIGARWSASGYVAAFMRASNEIWEVPRERRFFRKLPVRLGLTVLMTVVLAIVAVALVVTVPSRRRSAASSASATSPSRYGRSPSGP